VATAAAAAAIATTDRVKLFIVEIGFRYQMALARLLYYTLFIISLFSFFSFFFLAEKL